jgi:hypothetical protein
VIACQAEVRKLLNPFDALVGIGAIPHEIAQAPNLIKGWRIGQHGLKGHQVGVNVRDDQIVQIVITPCDVGDIIYRFGALR